MDLSELGAKTCGLWTRQQALAAASPGVLRTMLREGWQTVLPGVYTDGGVTLDATQRAWAAVLASGGADQAAATWRAVAMGRTAARVWRIPLIDDDDPATDATEHLLDDVAVRDNLRTLVLRQPIGPARTLFRHQAVLGPDEVVRLSHGLLLTSRLRTLFDCALLLTHEALVCGIDAVLHAGLATPAALSAYADLRHGHRGAPAFRAAVEAADGRAESPHETLTRLLLLPALPTLVPQVKLRDRGGRLVARFDLGDEAARFAVESDGQAAHSGAQMVARDRKRDRTTWRLAWWTERVTWFEVRRRPQQTVRWVVAQHREHVQRHAA